MSASHPIGGWRFFVLFLVMEVRRVFAEAAFLCVEANVSSHEPPIEMSSELLVRRFRFTGMEFGA